MPRGTPLSRSIPGRIASEFAGCLSRRLVIQFPGSRRKINRYSSAGRTYYGPNFEYTNTSAIPEPSVCALMLLGFAGLGFAGYRATRKGLAFAT